MSRISGTPLRLKTTAAAALAGVVFCCVTFAQPPEPPSLPGHKPGPDSVSATRSLIDAMPEADVREAITLMKSNYFNPDALADPEMTRATLEGLIVRLAPGASILQAIPTSAEPESPFRSEILDNRIGYIRPGSLTKNPAAELDAALKNFSDKSLKSVVLDFRATPAGGDFSVAAGVAGCFCPKGRTLFSIRKPGAGQDRVFTTGQDPLFRGIVVALVDSQSAGASEVLAAVLRAQTGALIIGEPTRGQAVEYSEIPLRGGKILRIAEAQVCLPDKPPIFPHGVQPDLVVKLPVETTHEIMQQSLQTGISRFVFEKERPRMNEAALVAGRNPELDALEEAQNKAEAATQPTPLRDTVLQRAVDFITTFAVCNPGPGQ